jgi:flagellar biogenesis protein FliO
MAMIGLICFAVFVYKKITDGSMRSGNTKFLSIEETMSLNPRKTLHIVRAGNEKFLIAADIDRTTLISKLEWNKTPEVKNIDRFREISPVQEVYMQPQETNYEPYEPAKTASKQVVHLEDINPERHRKTGATRNLDTLYGNSVQTNTKRVSPMKEMAKRINEL